MSYVSENKQTIGFIVGLLTIVSTGMGATWYLSQMFERMQNEVTLVRNEVSAFEKDRYTLTMASEKALRTAIENPGHRVVDPREPSKVIVVQARTKDD